MLAENKKKILGITVASLLLISFCLLAIWQMKRYIENNHLVSEKTRLSKEPPLDLVVVNVNESLRFRKVSIQGFVNQKVFVVVPGKSAGGLSGRHFHIFVTPEKGEYSYLVNAGFASSKTNPEAYLKTLPNKIQVEGTFNEIYPLRDAGLYKVGDPSEFAIPPMSADVLSAMSGLKVYPGIIETGQPVGADLEKNASRVMIKPEMNFVYFLQWLTLTILTGWWIKKQIKD